MADSNTPEIVVNVADPTPPFEQIRRQIVALISSGVLASEERLPSVRQLANDLGVAPGTIGRAYRELEAGGWIRSRRGGGTRVHRTPPISGDPNDELTELADRFTKSARLLGHADSVIVESIKNALLKEK